MCYPCRGEMRWEVTDIASPGSHRAGHSGLSSFSAISQSSHFIADLEKSQFRQQVLFWENLLVCKFDTDCLCSRPSARFYTFISPESVILEHYIRHTVGFTPPTIAIALLNNERFWLGSKNKIFETINLPTKMIECLSKCQDYNQRLIFMIYDCAVNMN